MGCVPIYSNLSLLDFFACFLNNDSMKTYLRAIVLFVFATAILNVGPIQAKGYSYNGPYFSYERFLPAMVLLESIPEKSGPQGELNKFAKDFSDGIYALSSEEYTRALRKLLRARRIWPEYFGTDFLIALVYEGRGDYRAAARYYKGYLNKLKALEAGEYPISGRIIQSIITSETDRYDIAYELVRDHLDYRGIDIADVHIPFSSPPSITLFVIFLFLCSMIYAAVHFFIAPYMKKRKRIKTLPGEYWICKNCGTANLNLIKECEECGREK